MNADGGERALWFYMGLRFIYNRARLCPGAQMRELGLEGLR